MKMSMVTLLLCSFFTTPALASKRSARDFIDAAFSRSSWKDMRGEVHLDLRNKYGDHKRRELKIWSKKNHKDESSILMRFVKPADVRGIGFLLIEHEDANDDRRLFLPALRRIQRISTSGSGGNFMSSDFTYYDIGRPKLRDWRYGYKGERLVDGVKCILVSGEAANEKVRKDTGYGQIVWAVDPSRMVVLASDFFDKRGKKFKVLQVKKIETISGTPFATHMVMRDLRSGHKSEMRFAKLKTNSGIPDRIFTSRHLLRWTR